MKHALIVLLILLSSTLASASFSCSDANGADLIILLDESVNNITYSSYLQSTDLPDDWEVTYQARIDNDEFIVDTTKSWAITASDYDDDTFLEIFEQVIVGDTQRVYVKIQSFSNYDAADRVFKSWKSAYDSSVNVKYDSTNRYGRQGFTAEYLDSGNYVISFVDNRNRYIEVITPEKSVDASTVAELYSNFRESLLVKETRTWRARVCNENTPECTRYLYYSPTYDTVNLLECNTNDLDCPNHRIEQYANYLKLPFPSCKRGEILELEYERSSNYPVKNRFWSPDDYYFQREYPSNKLSFTLDLPEGMDLTYTLTDGVTEDKKNIGDRIIYSWSNTDVESYNLEYNMPPAREVFPRLTYTSLKSWSDVEEWFEELFTESANQEYVKPKVDSIIDPADSSENKSRIIYEWVRDEIRYEESEIGFLTGYQPHSCEEVSTVKFGDCKDQTILLTSMLNAAGIQAYPVLVTRDSYDPDVPSPYEFYHSIVAIPLDSSGYTFLDPTCISCPYGYIPPGEQNVDVMILLDNTNGFIKTPFNPSDTPRVSESNYSIEVDLMDSFMQFTIHETGTWAVYLAHQLKNSDSSNLEDNIAYLFEPACSDFDILDYELLDLEDSDITIRVDGNCRSIGSLSSDGTILLNLESDEFYSDLTKADARNHQVILEGNEVYKTYLTLKPPSDHTFDIIPSNYTANEIYGSYSYSCEILDDELSCMRTIELKEVNLSPQEYNGFKEHIEKINQKENHVILKLKTKTIITTPTTTQPVTSTTHPESNACTPALPAAIALMASLLLGVPYILKK